MDRAAVPGWRLKAGRHARSQAELRLTFPLRFAEVVSGDGSKVYRQRIDLTDTGPFGERTVKLDLDLAGRNWVRLEAWDIACNGAFTQPVWLGRCESLMVCVHGDAAWPVTSVLSLELRS